MQTGLVGAALGVPCFKIFHVEASSQILLKVSKRSKHSYNWVLYSMLYGELVITMAVFGEAMSFWLCRFLTWHNEELFAFNKTGQWSRPQLTCLHMVLHAKPPVCFYHILRSTWLKPAPVCVLANLHRAIRSGIYNDLGSGSNVDIMIITKEGSQYLRNHEYLMDKTYSRKFPVKYEKGTARECPALVCEGRGGGGRVRKCGCGRVCMSMHVCVHKWVYAWVCGCGCVVISWNIGRGNEQMHHV